MRRAILTAVLLAALTGAGQGQDHAAHIATDATVALPEICGTAPALAHEMPVSQKEITGDVDEAHQALIAGMDPMHSQMMAGMQAADIDVAFICGMIPHHQGAIAMARAELQHGDDQEVRIMAEKLIAAQEAEIAEMLEWLARQAE